MLPYIVTIFVLVIVSVRKKREDQPPAITLPIEVARYLDLETSIPAASAVAGFSTTARR